MIYFSGISIQHLDRREFPDDTPRFSSVADSYRMFVRMHFKMLRSGQADYDPYYRRYLACVEHFNDRLRLSYQEFRNVVAVLVGLYQQYYRNTSAKRLQSTLDNIGKFERLIYLYTNKTFPTQTSSSAK